MNWKTDKGAVRYFNVCFEASTEHSIEAKYKTAFLGKLYSIFKTPMKCIPFPGKKRLLLKERLRENHFPR